MMRGASRVNTGIWLYQILIMIMPNLLRSIWINATNNLRTGALTAIVMQIRWHPL